MITFKDEYFSASTNRSLNSIDYKNDLFIFGSSNAIIVYNLKTFKVVSKLDGHTDKVNCVKFFDSGNRILSCSGDKSAIIWKKINENDFEKEYILKDNKSSIDLGGSIVLNDGNVLTLVFTNDFLINVWLNDKLVNSIKEKHFVLDLKIIHNLSLFKDQILVLIASSDCNVYLKKLDDSYNFSQTMKFVGHFDWVRTIDFVIDQDNLLIASGSQDNYIRIWKVGLKNNDDKLKTELYFNLNGLDYHIILDTVISGHEDKVHCVKWLNKLKSEDTLELISVSLDKTTIIWKQPNENSSDVWFEKNRFGELSSNNLGFLSCIVTEDNCNLIINSFNGALHYWKFDKQNEKWFRKSIISGHYLAVTDITWDLNDNYLLSISLDTTCRLHVDLNENWIELARPQVHGHELNCISIISSTKFVTGAAEKVLRVYEGTNFFIESFENLKKIKLSLEPNQKLADFAAVPNLGLSNYAVNKSDLNEQKEENKIKIPETFTEPPKEESLIANTLWPEIQKLYGHNYELFSVAVNHNKKHLASACKSTNVEDGAVFIWQINNNYKLLQKLHFHKLTVTAIRFSPDYNYLVSVSRDRNWALYNLSNENNKDNYELISSSKNDTILHSRIIWDVAWTPDNKFFLTCSRDKKVFIHSVDQNENILKENILVLDDVPMTIDVSKKYTKEDDYFIAIGLENGCLEIFSWSLKSNWIKLNSFKNFHSLSIKKVRFNNNGDKLATCGEDCFLRVISFKLINNQIEIC